MDNEQNQYSVAISMMYALSQIGAKKATVLHSETEQLVTTGKFHDLGNELVIPKSFITGANSMYSTHHDLYTKTVCEMIESYYEKKISILPEIPSNYREAFKKRQGEFLSIFDLHLCSMAVGYVERYLCYYDYYYDEEAFIELASLVAVELFKNYREATVSEMGYDEYNPSKNPGGFYTFKEDFNVKDFIEDHIDDIEGIWQEEEDDEDDDEDWD